MSLLWPPLLAFVLLVTLLYWLQRWISRHVQGIGMLISGSANAGMALYWFFVFPGVVLHELSHWLAARLLGVGTGQLRVSPTRQGEYITLGSVEVQRTDPLRDSVVGLAPFLAGTAALLAIGYGVFDVQALRTAWELNTWQPVKQVLLGALQVDDAWLWLYLVAAVSNAMMPSPSDRTSWRTLLIYMALVMGVLLLAGGLPSLSTRTAQTLAGSISLLVYALALTLIINLLFAAVLAAVEAVLALLRGRRVRYR